MVLRGDDRTAANQNPIQRDVDGNNDTEPRHDATDYKEFNKPALIREVHRVQDGQNLQRSADGNKADLIAQLVGPLYEPSFETLSSRCRDLGLDQNTTGYELRKALDRRHRDYQFVPSSQLWTPQDLLQLCSFRGLGGSVNDPASLLYRLLKYELQVAQDQPQQGNRHELLDWRLIHCQDPCYYPAALDARLEEVYRQFHPHSQDTRWSEAYIGNGHPSFIPPRTNQERMEVELERWPILYGFEGHPAERWSQTVPLDGFQDVQWRGMKTLFRSFAGGQNIADWRSVQAAVQTIWLYAMDARRARTPFNLINEVARYRRLLYERLDASTRRRPGRGRLLDQLFDWRVEGTMEMVQLLADAYGVEILVHIPHYAFSAETPEGWEAEWKVLSRGSGVRQINLVHYSSINRWTHVRHIPHGEEPLGGFQYTAHKDIDPVNKYHRRPILEDPLLPYRIYRNYDREGPNYIVDAGRPDDDLDDLTRHRHDPTEDLYFTGGTGRPTTAEDYALIREARCDSQLIDNAGRETAEREAAEAAAARDAPRPPQRTPPRRTPTPAPRSTSSSGRGDRRRRGSHDDDDNGRPSPKRPRRRPSHGEDDDGRPSPRRPRRPPPRADDTEEGNQRGETPQRVILEILRQNDEARAAQVPAQVPVRWFAEGIRRQDNEDNEDGEEEEEVMEEEEDVGDDEVAALAAYLQRPEYYPRTLAGEALRQQVVRQVARAQMTTPERLAAEEEEEEEQNARDAGAGEAIAVARRELQETLQEGVELARNAEGELARQAQEADDGPDAFTRWMDEDEEEVEDVGEDAELVLSRAIRRVGDIIIAEERETLRMAAAARQAEEDEEVEEKEEDQDDGSDNGNAEDQQEESQEDDGSDSNNVETQPAPARVATRQWSWLRRGRTTVPETQQEETVDDASGAAPNPPAPRTRASRRLRSQPPAGTTPPRPQKTPKVDSDGSRQEGDSDPASPTPAPKGRGGVRGRGRKGGQ